MAVCGLDSFGWGRGQWQSLVIMVMYLWVLYQRQVTNILTSWVTISFWRTLLQGDSSRHETRNSQKFSCPKSEMLGALCKSREMIVIGFHNFPNMSCIAGLYRRSSYVVMWLEWRRWVERSKTFVYGWSFWCMDIFRGLSLNYYNMLFLLWIGWLIKK